jgi:hypothetical protein
MSRRNWLTFEEARMLARDECIAHRAEYFKWHDWNKPKQIPKYPQVTYKDQWVSWNDWLGNNNTFKGVKKKCRPFTEAVAWVHKLKLKSSAQWIVHVREHGIPDDIPSHPELYYDQWVSWPHWIGNTLSKRVAVAQKTIEECGLLYIVHMPQRPANIFRIGIESGGLSAIRDTQAKMGFRVIKLFKMEVGYDWKALVDQYAKPWWENDAEYVVSNVNELMFELGSDLLFA